MGKLRNRKLFKIGMVFVAAAVLLAGYPGGAGKQNVYAAPEETAAKKTGAPDTAGLFYSNTISVYDNTVYAIEAGNLVRKTVNEDDSINTEILAENLADAKYLNITADSFYVVMDQEIVRIDRKTMVKTVNYQSENQIQLFILSPAGDFYTLENGEIYKNYKKDFTYSEPINLFCPIDGGYLFSVGSVLDYHIYVYQVNKGTSFISDAETWYVELDTLVVNRTDGDYMISIEDLFEKGQLADFYLYGGGDIDTVLADADGDGSGYNEPLTPYEDSVNSATLLRKTLSQGVQNCRLIARQMAEVKWTCLKDIPVFQQTSVVNKEYFKAGTTYYGIPYGQPIYNGGYVGPFPDTPPTITVDQFVAETKNINGKFYTQNANYNNRIMPTYSSDCSAFVSSCWDRTSRLTTGDFKTIADRGTTYANVGTNISLLAAGQALNTNGHIILVYDVAYDTTGNIAQVITIEQTPPIIRKRSWGVNGNYGSLADLQAKITNGYMIIKNLKIDSVGFTESEASKLDSADYINRISNPVSSRMSDTAAAGTGTVLTSNATFPIEGWSTHKDGCASFAYKIDNGSWTELPKLKKGNLYTFYADVKTPAAGTHRISVRGKTLTGEYYTVADFSIAVKAAMPAYTAYFDRINGISGMTADSKPYKATYTFASASAAKFTYSGWTASNDGLIQVEYKVDDGLWMPVETSFRTDVYLNGGPLAKKCPSYNAFNGGVDLSQYTKNMAHKLYLRGVTAANDPYLIADITIVIGSTSAAKPAVSSIALLSMPSFTEYKVGDSLNSEGVSVIATYADGSCTALYSGLEYVYDFSSKGEKTVVVEYGGRSTSFKVNVTPSVIYGDVNNDGAVTGADSVLLLQYLAQWNVTISSDAADVNGDGAVTGADSVLLLQYLAQWDVVIGK